MIVFNDIQSLLVQQNKNEYSYTSNKIKAYCFFSYLIAENVVVHIVLFRTLCSQHKSLRETTHWLSSIGEFTGHLYNNTIAQSALRIHLSNLRVTITEIQLLDFLMDLLLADHRCCFTVWIQAAMNERWLVVVESIINLQRCYFFVAIKSKLA